jgi:hypothetical protein
MECLVIHLSARLAWHDNGWDGCFCRAPHLNASCIVHTGIRDARDDGMGRAHPGVLFSTCKDGYCPVRGTRMMGMVNKPRMDLPRFDNVKSFQ